MSDFKMDWDRIARTGTSEAVLCDGKSAKQVDAIVAHAQELDRRLLLTRLAPDRFEALSLRGALDYDEVSRTAILGGLQHPRHSGRVAIVCGGTSDLSVALEASRTLAFEGEGSSRFVDVGVAGLWRLMEHLDDIRRHDVIIAVAGMEGAIFSVLTGLVSNAVIAVPTSVGYGVAAGGQAALNAALASCASGLAVVNIDNGFGAAHVALRMLARRDPSVEASDAPAAGTAKR